MDNADLPPQLLILSFTGSSKADIRGDLFLKVKSQKELLLE